MCVYIRGNSKEEHWFLSALRHSSSSITFCSGDSLELQALPNAVWARRRDGRRNTIYCMGWKPKMDQRFAQAHPGGRISLDFRPLIHISLSGVIQCFEQTQLWRQAFHLLYSKLNIPLSNALLMFSRVWDWKNYYGGKFTNTENKQYCLEAKVCPGDGCGSSEKDITWPQGPVLP